MLGVSNGVEIDIEPGCTEKTSRHIGADDEIGTVLLQVIGELLLYEWIIYFIVNMDSNFTLCGDMSV